MKKSSKRKITTKHVCIMLNCTPMTVFNYRTGNGKRLKSPLPHKIEKRGEERHAVLFDHDQVLRWAAKNGVEAQPLQATKS